MADNENKELINPFADESEEEFKLKKEKWSEIFAFCPHFSDFIIKLYDEGGRNAIEGMVFVYTPATDSWKMGIVNEPEAEGEDAAEPEIVNEGNTGSPE